MNYSSGSGDDLPAHARPDEYLAALDPAPTDWVTVLGVPLDESHNWAISSYLTWPAGREHALSEYTFNAWSVGSAGISIEYPSRRTVFNEGLRDHDEQSEFFVQRRTHHDRTEPSVEFTPSFLWYFDAIPSLDGSWYYLDDAGRDHQLVRIRRTDTELRIDVAALPLRRYLAVRERLLVVLHDRVTRLDTVPEPPIEAVDRTEQRHFAFHSGDLRSADRPGFVRLIGKQLVLPIAAEPADLARPHPRDDRFPEFTILVTPATGEQVTATCDPRKLSTYFEDRGTPHYLTRVYFRREVLHRYNSEPSRYSVSSDQVNCLDLWRLPLGANPEGLIETWLGDLGGKLPGEERDHWLAFNVPPRGGRDELRHRRDILGQWVDGPPDPVRHLFEGREQFSRALSRLVGRSVYREWDPADRIAFEGLHLPTSSEQSAADALILTLAKGVIDYLDVKAIRSLPGSDPKAETINCLEAWVKSTGGDPDVLTAPLRVLQGMRSSGPAHARTRGWKATLTRAGLDNLKPDEQFARLLAATADVLEALAQHANAQPEPAGPKAGTGKT
ncbi:hypothetical protein HRW14_20820 [Streptomyces lunaelactis]|uniref:hypothetical protein n=1 Tax=Streptomyces lunaelactis TaxID=1535768 RepID=UPI0015859879|nr:hypothetical protein [Streptomyces lunaelactis]NUK52676.1 hypothetical protein [Streptomyces lunaelactis]NUK67311.1 hypothetical protein [Streptomyces lunaelactis]